MFVENSISYTFVERLNGNKLTFKLIDSFEDGTIEPLRNAYQIFDVEGVNDSFERNELKESLILGYWEIFQENNKLNTLFDLT